MITRRELLKGMILTAGGLLIPEPVRVFYSIPTIVKPKNLLEILVPFTAMGETDIHSFPWLIKAKRRTLEWISNNYDRGDEVKPRL